MTLEEKIEQWMNTQGYPLEMLVAKSFQERSFTVYQSKYYKDPETGTSREIDVVAQNGLYTGKTFAFISYVVERKKSTNKPWVLFTRKNEIIDFEYTGWYCSNNLGWDYLVHSAVEDKIDTFPLTHHLGDRIAYGVTVAFTSGEDSAYKALQSTIRCAISKLKQSDKRVIDRSLEIVVPVIVVDGKLFESYLDTENQLVTQEIEHGVVLWDGVVSGHSGMAIHVITSAYINDFTSKAGMTSSRLVEDWRESLDAILDEMESYRHGNVSAEHDEFG